MESSDSSLAVGVMKIAIRPPLHRVNILGPPGEVGVIASKVTANKSKVKNGNTTFSTTRFPMPYCQTENKQNKRPVFANARTNRTG